MGVKGWFLCGLILMLCVSTASSLQPIERLKSLEDVDYIRVSGYISNGELLVTIIYKNMKTGELVYWEEGKIDVLCEVYENTGDTIERKKGKRIAVVHKNLTHNEQDLSINIPKMGKGKRGLIYCTINTGYREIRGRGDFWFK